MIANTQDQIEHLRTAGRALAEVLQELSKQVRPGITTAALDLLAEEGIRRRGCKPAFLGYKPEGMKRPFPAVLCVSINEEVVHGIPSQDRVLENGDIVSLDLGLSYQGYYVDSAVTVCAGECDADAKKLIETTREALNVAIAAAKVGNHVGDIGAAVETVSKRTKLSIVEDLGGHAVGKAVHEKPFIANFGNAGEGEKIVEGMVLALEPMLAEGNGAVTLLGDDWTYSMRDDSRAAHFEHTILVTKDGPEILTK
ncbi:MAG: methionyl aminopeptidase [Parcubacteria group bacterium Gr01-1014_56]|nr:MAG: methionyl aminopeptidase [Parcubacteria group bacterium Gr01-1014_56]